MLPSLHPRAKLETEYIFRFSIRWFGAQREQNSLHWLQLLCAEKSIQSNHLLKITFWASVFSRGKNHPKQRRQWNHPEMERFSVLYRVNIIIERSWSLYADYTSEFWEISIFVSLGVSNPGFWSKIQCCWVANTQHWDRAIATTLKVGRYTLFLLAQTRDRTWLTPGAR